MALLFKRSKTTQNCYFVAVSFSVDRLKSLIKKYKAAFLEKNNANKSSSKTSNANSTNDDDDGEGYHYTRMVNTNELYQDKTYD